MAGSRFEDVTFAYDAGGPAPSPTSPGRAGRHARWRWSARPAPARAPWPRWSPGCTTRRPAGSSSTASTCATCALADLARVVGVVSQETYLLHTTVRENLRYARPDATDAEIEDACRAARIHDVIAALPDGYDTVVGSRGHRFSGGEQQRLAIARTLLRDPAVLVLDEATSALDNETERAVQRPRRWPRAAPRSPSRTGCPPSATPTRSPSSTTDASSSSGSHDELVARGGRYAALLGRSRR